MSGPDHYREAERLANRADEIGASGARLDPGDPLLLLAQVHATLALAAATVNADRSHDGYRLADPPSGWENGKQGDGPTWPGVTR